VARYRKLVKAFRRRFGKRISAIGAWNEPNLGGEPTRYSKAGPKRAADYAWILRRDVCKPSNNCTAVAGEFQMKGQWKNYMTDYKDRLATRATVPSFWGAHPYIDVTKQTSALLDFFVTRLPPSATTVWLTEVGAHIDAKHVSTTTEAAQANRVEFLVNTEARRTGGPPIRRLYYYAMWEQNKFNAANFDTGLLTAGATTDTPIGGNRRQAYTTYKSHTLNNPRG
jgi:hypothetical protein